MSTGSTGRETYLAMLLRQERAVDLIIRGPSDLTMAAYHLRDAAIQAQKYQFDVRLILSCEYLRSGDIRADRILYNYVCNEKTTQRYRGEHMLAHLKSQRDVDLLVGNQEHLRCLYVAIESRYLPAPQDDTFIDLPVEGKSTGLTELEQFLKEQQIPVLVMPEWEHQPERHLLRLFAPHLKSLTLLSLAHYGLRAASTASTPGPEVRR